MNTINVNIKKSQPTKEEMPKKINATYKYQPKSTQVDSPAQKKREREKE